MIYECKNATGYFTIEWTVLGGWGPKDETKWAGLCDGETLAHASSPEAVLAKLVSGDCKPTPRGIDPSTAALPASLDAWKKVRS